MNFILKWIFYFQTKNSLVILEIDDWKKENVKEIKFKKKYAQEQHTRRIMVIFFRGSVIESTTLPITLISNA